MISLFWILHHTHAHFYRPQRSCGQGYIFAPVCHSVNRGGVCLSACWDTTRPPRADTPLGAATPPSRHPLEQTPPRADIPLRADTPPEKTHPWSRHTPPEQTPPPGADTPTLRADTPPPRADTPPEQTPPSQEQTHPSPPSRPPQEADTNPPWADTSPPREADSGTRSMSGRYASYWNTFLSKIYLKKGKNTPCKK